MARRREPPQPSSGPRQAVFHPEFRDDLRYWVQTDRRLAPRVLELVESALREPFEGIGKPEPLRHLIAGAWSRRVNEEYRLVYVVRGDRVEFVQARFHY